MTPAKKRRNAWIAALLIGSPLLWIIPTALYLRAQTQSNNESCERHLKVLGVKLLMEYPANHAGRLPDSKNWIAAVEKYGYDNFRCHADADRQHTSSYAMNADLSGRAISTIKNPSQVILIYETTSKAKTPFGVGKDLVAKGQPDMGQGRHHTIGHRFNFFLLADGTVRRAGTAKEMKTLRWTP